jgi:hypothetical protein
VHAQCTRYSWPCTMRGGQRSNSSSPRTRA